MVLVAAVALGSSTYAWFVTNNTVKATTSTISAQSNAAFMKIKYNAAAKISDSTADGYTMNATTLKSVDAPTAAVDADYTVVNVFNISSNGTKLTNLKVESAEIQSAR